MIQKLVCPECQTELKLIRTETTVGSRSTIKQTYGCPRCKKSVELWYI